MKVSSEAEQGRLKPAIGLLDLVMLGAGAAMGVSIFSVLGPAARIAGSGILITVFIAAAPMAVFAAVYAYMGSIAPRSGASYEWPRTFVNPLFGFLVAWLRILGSVGVLVTLSLVLAQYLGIPTGAQKLAMAGVLLAVYVVNVRGLNLAGRAQTVAMAALLLAFALFVATGAPHVSLALIGDPLARGWPAVLAATPLMIPLFLGLETSTDVGEEVKDAASVIPKALALALGLTVVVYIAVAFCALGLLGPAGLAASRAPLLDAARLGLGGLAGPIILAAALLALLKSLNAIFIVFSRYLFAMARAGVFPAVLSRTHPQWGTPHYAAALAFALTLLGLMLPQDLVFLFVTVSIPTVLKYLSTCLCAWRVWALDPRLARSSGLGFGRRTVVILAWTGVGCALTIFVLGLTADWRPFVLVAAWGAAGLGYWLAAKSLTTFGAN